MSMRWLFLFMMSLWPIALPSYALDVDQKLTLRVLKVTNSQKTVLINRGTEDGLVEGDHAKFFLSIGVVARGKVVKVSPTRSVWGLYRVVNADYIKKDSVMNLKITEPMKISSDETKAVVEDDKSLSVEDGNAIEKLGIPLAEGADDVNVAGLSEEEKKKIDILQLEAVDEKIDAKNLEVWTQISFLNSSANVSNDTSTLAASGNITSSYFRVGGEYYFTKEKDWFSNLSLNLNLAMVQNSALSFNGELASVNANEYGIGANWHFLNRPQVVGKIYPFISLAMVSGSVTDKQTSAVTALTDSATGSRSGMAYGLGFKWYAKGSWGVRAEIQLVSTADKMAGQTAGVNYERKMSGQRALLGLSYRW